VVDGENSGQAHVVLVLGPILFVVGLSLTLMGRTAHAVGGAAATTKESESLVAAARLLNISRRMQRIVLAYRSIGSAPLPYKAVEVAAPLADKAPVDDSRLVAAVDI
jgi:hypothetical protein